MARPVIDSGGENTDQRGRLVASLRDRLCADFEAGLPINWPDLLREVAPADRPAVVPQLLSLDLQLRRREG